MTDRELNAITDDVTAEIRNEKLDAAIVSGAAQRAWTRLSGEQAAAEIGVTPVEQIRSCEDFQTLIPAYLHGVLSSARTMLLEDHVRECVPCRKALKEARSGNKTGRQLEIQKARAASEDHRMAVLRWGIAAVLVVGLGMIGWPYAQRFMNSIGTLQAIVEAANGNVYKVSDNKTQTVKAGEKLRRGERIRTAKNAAAVIKLSDGSSIEMRERTEVSISDNATGATINLERGNIIVDAAKQRDRKLFVATDDALVSVTGTIFSVNNGTKGARVSVIEGAVRVDRGGKDQVLSAGQQVTTHSSIERVPVRDEIAWSRDRDRYTKLLEAVRNEIDQQSPMPGNRYSTRLLDTMPENTVLYVAIPNISSTLAEANRILQENVQNNPELREWWEKEQANRKNGLSEAIDLAREFGSYLGDEIALGAEAGANGGEPEEPIIIAELRNASGFHSFLESQLTRLQSDKDGPKQVRIIDDPMTTGIVQSKHELLVWVSNDLVAVSSRLDALKRLSARSKQDAKPFAATPFYAQISSLYREGAGLVIAADLEKMVMPSFRKDEERSAARQLGVTGLRYFIIEVKEKDGKPFNRAVVNFNENQHGVTSWLAQPGPMGALEFISPDANVVAAFVVKEPAALVDDLLAALKTADPKDWQELQDFQTEHGVDLRNDFAVPLGGEYAFAIDGPLLPVPSWKIVFEVDDPGHLQQTLERTVEKLNVELAKEGRKGLAWSRAEAGGKTFYTLRSLDLNVEVNYTYAFGYLIAAPSRALIENAIKYRESGYTLLQSSKFKATLPEDKQANFSAMVYQNLGSVVTPIARTVGRAAGEHAPKEARAALKNLLGNKAGLAYVYALNDRMIFSVNTEDRPLGLSASDLLGLPGSSGLGHIIREATR
ncbi:MAG: FecR domain-containing protein [Acidobacteria bacterium]|nr:FecR domain-containing protein [Acidobacteriota bacterium]